jgi:vanillate monooxygenase ferredoxin subunit
MAQASGQVAEAATLLVRIAQKLLIAEDVVRLELVLPDGGPLPAFEAGAHVELRLPGGLVRPYSLCNDPRDSSRYVLGVLREPKSRGGSRAVHEQLQVGQLIEISPPRNRFALASTDGRALLLAGGIGVTPLLAMAHVLHARQQPFALHHAVRSTSRAAFWNEMQASPFAANASLHVDDQPRSRVNLRGLLASPAADDHVYVCGPSGFMAAAVNEAKQAGWAPAHVHRELFSALPAAGPHVVAERPFTIELARSRRRIDVPIGTTALVAMESAGVPVAFSCEQGVCGTCILPLLHGEVDHRDSILTNEERASNRFFVPCCSRAIGPVLVVDL